MKTEEGVSANGDRDGDDRRARRRARAELALGPSGPLSGKEGLESAAEDRAGADFTRTSGAVNLEVQAEKERESAARSIGRNTKLGILTTLENARNWRELQRTPYGLGPIAVLACISFFQAFETEAYGVAGPDIARDLDINLGGIVGIRTMVGVILTLGGLYAAYYFDRRSRAKWIGFGTVLSGLSAMVQSGANGFGYLAAARVVNQGSERISVIPGFSLVADYYPPEARGRVFALDGLSSEFSGLMAIVVAGAAVQWLGWRVSSFIFGLPLVIMGVVALVKLREPVRGYFERKTLGASEEESLRQEDPISLGEAFRRVWAIRTYRRIIISRVWSYGGIGTFGLLFGFYLADEYGLSPFQRSLTLAPATAASLAGYYVGGGLIDFFSQRKPASVLLAVGVFDIIAATALFFIAIKPPLWVLVAAACVNAFGASLGGPASNALASQVIPPSVRTLGGSVISLALLPSLIIFTPLISGFVVPFGYTTALLLCMPFIILGALINMSAAPLFEVDRRNALVASMADGEARRAKAEGRSKLLVARHLDVEYSGVQVLFDVDFEIDEGDIIALLGTNGAGKSTLLRAISGTQEASNGAIVYDGRDITHMPPHEIASRGVVHMPGGRGVFPGLTVRENLLLGTWMIDDPEETRRRLDEVHEIFPTLRERGDALASQLSGGEQQQLSLAQAFLGKPRLLMIDELSLGLSPAVVGQLLEVVREIHRRGVTIVVVEQSVNVALMLADKAVFMEKGEIKFIGPTEELMRRPDILRAVYVKGSAGVGAGGGGGISSDDRRRRQELEVARPILEVQNVSKRFGGILAVDDVSFDVREGEILGVIGPNGSGKTTLFDLISGYQEVDSGRVRFDGADITDLPPEVRARRKLVRRFQDARMFGSLTVYETLLVALEQRLEMRSTFLSAFAVPQARRAERRVRLRADKLIEVLDLDAFRDKFVKELSTGLRRIVDLACVLAAEPRILLLDEPSSGIAQAEAESLGPLLKRVRFETGCSMLLIEHDMPLISAVSDELIALDRGAFVLRGPASVVLDDERVIESYLGGSEAAVNRSGSTT
jgi:ABC-type branched-subunit amino acid transport system ATPase component/MFS family permease